MELTRPEVLAVVHGLARLVEEEGGAVRPVHVHVHTGLRCTQRAEGGRKRLGEVDELNLAAAAEDGVEEAELVVRDPAMSSRVLFPHRARPERK